MTGTLNRYLLLRLFEYHVLTAVALSVLIGLFVFSDQAQDVEKGGYGLLDALWYVGMTAPERLLSFMPFVCLLGTLLALVNLAGNGEMTAMLAVGYRPGNVLGMALTMAVVMAMITVCLAQWLVPPLSQHAELRRMTQMSGYGTVTRSGGFWVRDGNSFLHVGSFQPGLVPVDLSIYEFTESGALGMHMQAKRAILQEDGSWLLQEVMVRSFADGMMHHDRRDEQPWYPFSGQRIREALYTLPPSSLSYDRLWREVEDRRSRAGDAGGLELLLWQRIASPLSGLAMAALAVPFGIFHSRGSRFNLGPALGVAAGVGFFLFAQILANMSLLWPIPFFVSSMLPVVLAALFAGLRMRRLRSPF